MQNQKLHLLWLFGVFIFIYEWFTYFGTHMKGSVNPVFSYVDILAQPTSFHQIMSRTASFVEQRAAI